MRKKHNIADEQQAFDAQEKFPLKSCLRNKRGMQAEKLAFFIFIQTVKKEEGRKNIRSSGFALDNRIISLANSSRYTNDCEVFCILTSFVPILSYSTCW